MNKKLTFIMPLKNRSKRAIDSIKTIVNDENYKYADFIVVEDVGKDQLNIPKKYKPYIKHYLVETGDVWNRSKLLNFGIKRSTTKYVIPWDSDILFPSTFISDILNIYIPKCDFDSGYILKIVCTETKNNIHGIMHGGLYVYDTNKIKKINGYDEKYIGWGAEEIDCNNRYIYNFIPNKDDITFYNKLHFSNYYQVKKFKYLMHQSHGDDIRHKINNNIKLLSERVKNIDKCVINKNIGNIKFIKEIL